MKIAFSLQTLVMGVSVSLLAAPAFAVPANVIHDDFTTCDFLFVPREVDELGIGSSMPVAGTTGPFPMDEEISAYSYDEHLTACEQTDNPDVPDAVVNITNLTQPPRTFEAMWYVGNTNTHFTNVDGVVSQSGFEKYGHGNAFRIDTQGSNRPLIYESLNDDGKFEPNETWSFIIQDFQAGGPAGGAADLASIGVAGGSLLGGNSSGSIIGIVPEPTSMGLLMLGMMGAVVVCRRN